MIDPSSPPPAKDQDLALPIATAPQTTSPTKRASWNLAAAVHAFALTQPSAPALVLDTGRYSYQQLAQGAAAVAHWLRANASPEALSSAGFGRVGVLASRSLETYTGILGAAWVGGTYVPINPKQPSARIASIVRRARLTALLVDKGATHHLGDAELQNVLPSAVLTAGSGPTEPAREAANDLLPPHPVSESHPAYVLFTSGTTGIPKGVEVCSGSVAHFLGRMRELYGIHPGDRVGQFGEASFDLSVFEIFAAWDAGAALHVVPENKLMAPAGFIREQELTVWTSVPSVLSILARLKMLEAGAFPSLRVSFFIGEALPTALAIAWQRAAPNSVVDNHYGPTEATVACTMQRLGNPALETPGRGTLAIGRAYDGLTVEVVDANGSFLPAGETGELAICGPQLATGYFGDDKQTQASFPQLHHPLLGTSRWYRTGDLGFCDDAGVLHCLGRLDHQVKVGGHRVELEDIEAHLRAASGADAVAAIAWPRHHGQAAGVVAFVCGATVPAAEIRNRMRALLPPYMVPRQVIAIEELPLSANGKVDRAALETRMNESRADPSQADQSRGDASRTDKAP